MSIANNKRQVLSSPTGDNGQKRARKEDPTTFLDLLEESGCKFSKTDQECLVDDPRRLRRTLEQRLTLNQSLRLTFLDGVREYLDPPDVLHAALRPMNVTGTTALVTGDSFIRALLNVTPLQKDLSEFLLQRIPEFSGNDDGTGGATAAGGTTSGAKSSMAQLILGQFRWLDCLADPHALTATLLEVLPAMPPEAQRDTVAFFPEIALEEDYPAVLDALEGLVAEGPEFLIPVLEATSNLALSDSMQARVTQLVASRVESADVEDLPAVVRHLLQGSGAGGATAATEALSTLRHALHFITLVDPRLAVPDRKQKHKLASSPADIPEAQVLAAMRQAVQFGRGVPDTILRDVRGLTSPQQHRTFDLWLLLVVSAVGSDQRRGVLAVLRKKFSDGHAGEEWILRSIVGHAPALTEHFSELLVIAQRLLADANLLVVAVGAALYRSLFTEFKDSYCRQEALLALHSHLGAAVPAEATAALGVLQRLAHDCTDDLLQYAAFLTNILDYVSGYSDGQLAAAFDVFAELVAGTCRGSICGDPGDGDASMRMSLSEPGVGTTQGGKRSRMEDELFIFLRKQLSGALPCHRRVGAVGTVALVQRLSKEMGEHGVDEAGDSLLAQRYRESRHLLDSTLAAPSTCADTTSFLCDTLATEAQRGALPRSLVRALARTLQETLEQRHVMDLQEWKRGAAAANPSAPSVEAWWNLNGSAGDAVITLTATKGSSYASGTQNGATQATAGGGAASGAGSAAALFPMLRAVVALTMEQSGNLGDIDALLGLPMGLFPMAHASPDVFVTLDAGAQRSVLLGLFFAINWCRELVGAFAPATVSSDKEESTPLPKLMSVLLMSRLRAACQLEAALATLLPMAPANFQLPALGPGQGDSKAGTAAAASAPKKKAPAGRKKPAAKRERAEDDEEDEDRETNSMGPPGSTHDGSMSMRSNGSGDNPDGRNHASPAIDSQGSLPPAERQRLRTLQPSALGALSAGAECSYAALAPAAYILSDLAEKLNASLSAPKKFAFFRPAVSKSTVVALSPVAILAATCPTLPALRRHLDTAARVQEGDLTEKAMLAHDTDALSATVAVVRASDPDAGDSMLSVLPNCPAASAAVSPFSAAPKTMASALECVRQIFTFQGITAPEHRASLHALLAAFAAPGAATTSQAAAPSSSTSAGLDFDPSAPTWTSTQLLQAVTKTFMYFLQLAPTGDDDDDDATASEMERWPAVLTVLESLICVVTRLSDEIGDPKIATSWARKLGVMREKLSESAGLMLQQRWPGSAGGNAGEPAGGWKGRAAPLSAAIRLTIAYSSEPVDRLREFLQQGILEITTTPTGKDNATPHRTWPSLSGLTLQTWYRALWDALLCRWGEVAASAAAIGKAPDAAPDAAAAIFTATEACCSAFPELLGVVKEQDRRPLIHNVAAKAAGVFMNDVLRVMPFWGAIFEEQGDEVKTTIKSVQRGTRILHTLCAVGKTRRDISLTSQVPKLKKFIERFVLETVVFLQEHDPSMGVELGELKHRDLRGNALQTSQMYPSQLGGDDDEEDSEEEEEEEEEDEGGEGGVVGESQGVE